MAGKRRSALAACLFFAFTAPFGIAAHLVSELAGLGWRDDSDVVFSSRHGYLAVIAAAALLVFTLVLRAVPARARRRRIAEVVDALPFGGRGAGFASLSFALQFGFFALTQIGEGCPLCGGDALIGVFAAALAAMLGALTVTFGKRRFFEFAAMLVWYESERPCAGTAVLRRAAKFRPQRSPRRSPFAFRYRPPPLAV